MAETPELHGSAAAGNSIVAGSLADPPQSRGARFGRGARAEGQRFLRFLVVGGCCFVIETAALSAFVFWLGFDRVLAKGLAFVLAMSCSFLGTHFWVYRDSRGEKPLATQGIKFAIVSLSALAVNLLVFSVVDSFLRDGILPAAYSLYAAHVSAVGIALFWNFALNRLVTYRHIRIGQ